MNDFQLFVAHDIGVERTRRLGRHQRDQLQDVVLHHVAQRARPLVVARARADPFLFRHRDLDVVDVLLIEKRFEDAVGEPEHQDVLDRFLTQIVIDAVDLPLVEDGGDRIVDRASRGQIASDRLLDDQPRERRRIGRPDEPRGGEVLDRGYEHRRRHRQVIDAVAGQVTLVLDGVEVCAERSVHRRVVEGPLVVEQRLREPLPVGVFGWTPGELGRAVFGEVPIRLVGERLTSDTHDRKAGRKQTVDVKVVERGQQLAMRKIAGAAEDHDRDRVNDDGGFRVSHRAGRRGRRTRCAAPRAGALRTGCPHAIGTA